jgi:hypothetical protein
MHPKLTIAALAAALAALAALPAQARPYLMLSSDEHGFEAMDLGNVRHDGIATAEATLITAPLAGAPYEGDKLAPVVERRVTVDCTSRRWRVTSTTWTDSHEVMLSSDQTVEDWRPFDDDDLIGPQVQDAACLSRFKQQLVSRYLNLGEIFTNYQRAWGRTAPETLTETQLLQQKFRDSH